MSNQTDREVHLEVVVEFVKQAVEPTFDPCVACGTVPANVLTQCSQCGHQTEQQKAMVESMEK